MTDEQINALLDETITKPKAERTELHDLAFIAAYRRLNEETQNLIGDILSGEIGVAVSVTVLR